MRSNRVGGEQASPPLQLLRPFEEYFSFLLRSCEKVKSRPTNTVLSVPPGGATSVCPYTRLRSITLRTVSLHRIQ